MRLLETFGRTGTDFTRVEYRETANMKLPNHEEMFAPSEKIIDYLLSSFDGFICRREILACP